jgi:membrane protein implicated in regulation of membrane protease activity
VTAALSLLGVIGLALGAWVLLSIVSALLLVPWIRSRARANAALGQSDPHADAEVATPVTSSDETKIA